MSNNVYFGGMPTGPDIKKIREQYPDRELVEGETEIAHYEIGSIIKEDIDSTRFKTVTTAWRKAVEVDSGKIIVSQNKTFSVLDDSGKLGTVKGGLKAAGRKIRRAKIRGGYIDRKRLSDDERKVFDSVDYRLSKIAEAHRIASKSDMPRLPEGD